MKDNEKGFGLVELLLILIIVGLISGLSWYIYKQQSNSSLSNSNTSTAAPASTVSNAKYLNYENKEFSFKFSYPKEWGKVTVRESNIKGKNGKSYDILFGEGFGKFAGGFVTKDWSPENPSDNYTGFVMYDACRKSASDVSQVFLYKTDTACISITGENATSGGEGNVSATANIIMKVSLTKNSKISGLQFFDAPVAVTDTKTETIKNAYTAEGKSAAYTAFIKTIQEL